MNPVKNLQKTLWYVYILESLKDKLWYTGCTKDIVGRINEHNDGKVYATKNRKPFKPIYCEISYNKLDAFSREKYLKSGMGKKYLKNRLKYYYGEKNQ
ncbi:MAG: GIY-YIG nuclease family protein [Patescibacteria group bacterium]|jgi:putative endonuclease